MNALQQAEACYNQAVRCQQLGDYALAEQHYRQVIQLCPDSALAWQELGNLLRQQQRFDDAYHHLYKAWELAPEARVAFRLGLLAQQQTQWEAAATWYQQALTLKPDYPQAWNNLGNVQLAAGHFSAAIDSLTQATTIQPTYVEAWYNLAQAKRQFGEPNEALACYQQVLTLKPDIPEVYYHMANLHMDLAQPEQAQIALEQAVQLNPQLANAHNNLANLYKMQGQLELARRHYEHCIEAEPTFAVAYMNLAALEQEQANTPAAQQWLTQAPSRDALRLLQATLWPPVVSDAEAPLRLHQELQHALQALEADGPLHITDPLAELPIPLGFYLAYQSQSNHGLLAQISRLVGRCLPREIPLALPPQSKRIRVGFVSRYFCQHSISDYVAPLLFHLPPEQFEVILYAAPHGRQDELTSRLKAATAHWIPLPADLSVARQVIVQSAPEALIYTDLGTEPFTWLLAHTRLAPVQATMLGHPITSGIDTIDYYLSAAEVETADSQSYYIEQLVALPGLPAAYAYPAIGPAKKNRSDLGLSETAHIYMCPATLFKLHPDFDRALAHILAQDAQAQVYLFHDRAIPYHVHVQRRFEQTLKGQHQRIKWLPWASRDDFFDCLRQADVVLDTFYFGGGNTAFLTMAVEAPTVTWPAPWARGRTYEALYRRLAIPELVSESITQFAERAVTVATQPDWRQDVVNRIQSGKRQLYGDMQGVRAFGAWLQRMLRG